MSTWHVYTGSGQPHDGIKQFIANVPPPAWRRTNTDEVGEQELAEDPELAARFSKSKFHASPKEVETVNAAIYLRRPLLVTGKPGTGKTSLAYAIAHELKLGSVLRWSITSRSTLQDALYRYDAIGRLQEANLQEAKRQETSRVQQRDGDGRLESRELPDIGRFIRLGPVGTALLPARYPRVLLIDEIDKSDVDLPNDLLHVFEEGRYEIPELTRLSSEQKRVNVFPFDKDEPVPIVAGRVSCQAFPIVILTNNGEREFPPAFLRRCIRLNIPEHNDEKLALIVNSYFEGVKKPNARARNALIAEFLRRSKAGDLSTDQLLNAIYLVNHDFELESPLEPSKEKLIDTVLQYLNSTNV